MTRDAHPYVFRTTAGQWIIRDDRLCRSDRAIDPMFVPVEHWERIDQYEIGETHVRAHLCSGGWVSAALAAPIAIAS